MLKTYSKTFVFKEYSDEATVNENVAAINKLLNNQQFNEFGAYRNKNDGTWVLAFYRKDSGTWMTIPFRDRFYECRELHVSLEIEEETNKVLNYDITLI